MTLTYTVYNYITCHSVNALTLTCTHTYTHMYTHTHTDMDRRTDVPVVSWYNILQLLLNVLQCCPHSVMTGASRTTTIGADWSEVSELWFLSMQGESGDDMPK